MAKGQKTRIVGGKDVQKALQEIGIAAGGDTLEEITLDVAEIIRVEAVRRAPELTGALKLNIDKKVIEKKESSVVVVVGPLPGRREDAFYGHFIEFGTDPHEIPPGRRHPGIIPQPFLRPAFDENIDRAIKEAAQRFKKKLNL